MRTTDTHVYFWGSFLSNFYWKPFKLGMGGAVIDFTTSEQAFMAMKAFYFNDIQSMALILEAPDAKSAKAIGRKVKGFDIEKWNAVSYKMMLKACSAKFLQNDDVAQQLLDTGTRILVEASPSDRIWGVGLHETDDLILDEANWRGENRLGKVLMVVREHLKELKRHE